MRLVMASKKYTLEDVVARMQDLMSIPGPVEDDDEWSEDEFDGYVDDMEEEVRDEDREIDRGDDSEWREAAEQERMLTTGSSVPRFSATPGCTHHLTDGTPLQFFNLLVDDAMLDNIVEQTCLYASQFIASNELGPRSRVHQWNRKTFDRDELKKFLALIVVMGLINLPQIEDHWVTSWPYCSQTFSKVKNTC